MHKKNLILLPFHLNFLPSCSCKEVNSENSASSLLQLETSEVVLSKSLLKEKQPY